MVFILISQTDSYQGLEYGISDVSQDLSWILERAPKGTNNATWTISERSGKGYILKYRLFQVSDDQAWKLIGRTPRQIMQFLESPDSSNA